MRVEQVARSICIAGISKDLQRTAPSPRPIYALRDVFYIRTIPTAVVVYFDVRAIPLRSKCMHMMPYERRTIVRCQHTLESVEQTA